MAFIFRYRKKIILGNLQNAFPEAGEKEIRKIAHRFYRHLADVIFETIKLLTRFKEIIKLLRRFKEIIKLLRKSSRV